jgi:CBS domain containing-hemolysin-like protein
LDNSALYGLIASSILTSIYALLTFTLSGHIALRPEKRDEESQSIQLTVQLLGLGIVAAVVEIQQTTLIQPLQSPFPTWVHTLILIPSVTLVYLFGFVVPDVLGRHYAHKVAGLVKMLANLVLLLFVPFMLFLTRTRDAVLNLFKIEDDVTSITEEELISIIEEGDSFEEGQGEMIRSVLELNQTTVTEMMVPRIDMVAVDKRTSIAEARQVFLESRHSRLPVYDGNIDTVIGLLYVKDLLDVWHNGQTTVQSVEEIMRKALFVPESITADRLLAQFQRHKTHLAIVLEEYGGTAGLVTLEDLLEEIVGDIQDEYDDDEAEEFITLNEREFRADASITITDLNHELRVDLTDEDVDTLGGYLFTKFERIPEVGETFELQGYLFKVEKLEGRRIRTVHIQKLQPEEVDQVQPTTDL